MAGAEQHVHGGPVGVAVPVIYQRADGSAHVIAAVRAGDGVGVDLLDAQKREAEAADVLAAVGLWVIPVSGVEVEGEVVLPAGGSGLRRLGWGSGLPTVVTGPKRWGGVSGPVAGPTRVRGVRGGRLARVRGGGWGGFWGVKRRKVDAAVAVGAVSGSLGDGGSGVLTPTDQAVQQDPSAERKQKEWDTERSRARKATAARVTELEELKEQGRLTEEQGVELAELQPKVAQRKQKRKRNARYRRAGKAAADRVVVLEALAERGPLTVEQEGSWRSFGRRRSSGRNRRNIKRSITGRERLLLIVLWCWRSWRRGGR